MQYRGYTIAESRPTGGKAGKGHNKTATIQVREPAGDSGYLLKKQFRFPVDDDFKCKMAYQKAKAFVDNLLEKR